MPKVSVIMPIHNSEKWLHRAVDSVLNQTLTDIEILIVNDDSTDGTQEILNQYAKQDSRIQLFYRQHEKDELWGYTNAVNIGRKIAKGEYVIFPDSDDILLPQALEQLYEASEGIADVVKGGHSVVNKKNETVNFPMYSGKIQNWQNLNSLEKVLHLCPGTPQLQSCLIKKEFQKDISFCKYCFMDTTTVFKFKVLANDFRYLNKRVYVSINDSGDDKKYTKYLFHMLKVFDDLEQFLKDYHIDDSIWYYFNYLKILACTTISTYTSIKGENALNYYLALAKDFKNIELPSELKNNSFISSMFYRIKALNT